MTNQLPAKRPGLGHGLGFRHARFSEESRRRFDCVTNWTNDACHPFLGWKTVRAMFETVTNVRIQEMRTCLAVHALEDRNALK